MYENQYIGLEQYEFELSDWKFWISYLFQSKNINFWFFHPKYKIIFLNVFLWSNPFQTHAGGRNGFKIQSWKILGRSDLSLITQDTPKFSVDFRYFLFYFSDFKTLQISWKQLEAFDNILILVVRHLYIKIFVSRCLHFDKNIKI